MQKNNSPVSVEELRKFGFMFAGILIFVFGMLLPWLIHHTIRVWPFYIGLPVALLAAVWPAGLRSFYRLWMKFGAVMGFINTRIIMSVLFFFMFTPIAWLMKALGKDPMKRALEKNASSYRVQSAAYTKDQWRNPTDVGFIKRFGRFHGQAQKVLARAADCGDVAAGRADRAGPWFCGGAIYLYIVLIRERV